MENAGVLVAIGVDRDGRREVIGVAEGMREDMDSWEQFVRSMIERALKGVRLVVGDRRAGFVSAGSSIPPKVKYQSVVCALHEKRALQDDTHRKWAAVALQTVSP